MEAFPYWGKLVVVVVVEEKGGAVVLLERWMRVGVAVVIVVILVGVEVPWLGMQQEVVAVVVAKREGGALGLCFLEREEIQGGGVVEVVMVMVV